MAVLSVRISEQQKGEIEQAALAAKLSVPDYIRRSLATNQNDVLTNQMDGLKSEGKSVAAEVEKLRSEIAALSEQAGKTAADLRANAQAASGLIKRHIDSDILMTLGIAGLIGWTLALSAAVLATYLMN